MDLTVSSPHPNFFVVDAQNHLRGVISIHDLRSIIYESDALESLLVADDLSTPIEHYFTPEDTLDIVMKAFGEINVDELPVVNDEINLELIGTVSKNQVIELYNQEIFKRDMVTSVSSYMGSLSKFKRVELMDGHVLGEIEVPGDFVDKTLRELDLRNRFGVEVILIKQGYDAEKKEKQKIISSQPDYRFKFGDTILIMGSQEGLENIKFVNNSGT